MTTSTKIQIPTGNHTPVSNQPEEDVLEVIKNPVLRGPVAESYPVQAAVGEVVVTE